MHRGHVLTLLSLFVGFAHSFSWDIVVGDKKQLKFYNNGTLEKTEHVPAANDITAVNYDPVNDRVLLADYHHKTKSISSFDISTREVKRLVTKNTGDYIKYLVHDPVTQLLFWQEEDNSIYSISLKPASSSKAVHGNLLVTLSNYCGGIDLDSCGGFIYWATNKNIERAAFDGSEREVLIDSAVYARPGLAIDQKTQTMYWTEEITSSQFSIESADLNGKNRRTFHSIGNTFAETDLVVSNDFIYWKSYTQSAILRLPKSKQRDVEPTVYSKSSSYLWPHQLIASKYTIKEQTLGIKGCEALKTLILDVEERNFSICHNYCFQGNCSVSAEAHPTCRCNAGYSGERCEVNACHKHCLNNGDCSLNEEYEPVCQCTADYEGERCDVASTKHTGVHAEEITQQILRNLRSEVKQIIREELQCTLQFYSDKLDEHAAKIHKCEELMKDDLQNHNEITSERQTSCMNF